MIDYHIQAPLSVGQTTGMECDSVRSFFLDDLQMAIINEKKGLLKILFMFAFMESKIFFLSFRVVDGPLLCSGMMM